MSAPDLLPLERRDSLVRLEAGGAAIPGPEPRDLVPTGSSTSGLNRPWLPECSGRQSPSPIRWPANSSHSRRRGYHVQIAVDPKHNLIAEQQVHIKVIDVGLLAQTAVAARENLAVEKINAVADKGYYKIGDIEACEGGGTPHVPKPVRSPSKRKGLFTKARFQYDGTTDTWPELFMGSE